MSGKHRGPKSGTTFNVRIAHTKTEPSYETLSGTQKAQVAEALQVLGIESTPASRDGMAHFIAYHGGPSTCVELNGR